MLRYTLFFICLIPFVSIGQKKYRLSFYQQNEEVLALEKTVYFKSKKELLNYTKDVRNENLRKGYVLANIDSLAWKDSISASAYMYRGPQFDRLKISVAEEDRFLMRKIPRLSERFLRNVSFYPAEVERVLSEVLSFLENNGFPYASVRLIWDGVYASENQAELIINRGPEVILTKIHIKGEAEVSEKFLTNLIAIREGDYFNQERLERISARIKQTLFLDEIKPHELLFTPEGFELFLYLKTAPVSLVNGVVGLQPNSVTGKSVFTGDVRLRLQNVLKRGELFDVNWRSLQPQTQDLKIKLNYPFLLNTPFGIDGALDLYKRDTTFLTTVGRIGVQYFLSGGSYIKVFYEGENSNLLSGAQSSSLGNLSSVSSNRYGLGFFRRQLDYLPNPSKGFFIEVNGLIGARTSRVPASDSVTSSTTYAVRLDLEWFVPLAKRHVLRITNNTRAYYAPEVFTNELNRFGGLTTQRGFDE